MSKDRCFLIPKRPTGGGGTQQSMNQVIVRRTAAIGDSLCATVVADKLVAKGYDVFWQTHPNIFCVIRRHPNIDSIGMPKGFCHVNLDGAYEQRTDRTQHSFAEMFLQEANRQLAPMGINLGKAINCKPHLLVPDNERQAVRDRFSQYPRPWIFICPRSNSYAARTVQDHVWNDAAAKMPGTKFWIGNHGPAPANIVDLKCQHFDNVIIWLSVADMLVTVDTGPLHIAAALNIPIVALNQSSSPHLHINDQNDFIEIDPEGNLNCLNCQKNLCPKQQFIPPCQKFDPEKIAAAVKARLRSISTEDVTAVISIFKPRAETLNRCLNAVIPQVQEVVVTRELNGILPDGVLHNDKVTFVQKQQRQIGYGRNANFGARHANGKYLLFLNDDCYLEPNAVERLRECMKEGVGMVGHLLRMKDGRIQHGGKFRARDGIGFGHIDHNRFLPSIKEPREVENVTGTSILVRRKAYYEVDCHDEEYFLYCEDDQLCMDMRASGWKVIYTPHAVGIHDEHLSTGALGNLREVMMQSQRIFARNWKWYFDLNRNTGELGKFA